MQNDTIYENIEIKKDDINLEEESDNEYNEDILIDSSSSSS